MDREIYVKFKYGWMRSRGDAKIYESAKYQRCRINRSWETDLKGKKLKKVTGEWNIDYKWPSSKLDLEIIKSNILSKNHDIDLKMWTLECYQGLPLIWSGDLASFWLGETKF